VSWFVVACTEILERLPADHPRRTELITTLSEVLQGIKAYQDPTTGLWYEVVDKGNNATQWLDNWVEQSSGCMYTYALAKAIAAGYVSAEAFRSTAQHGYAGSKDAALLIELPSGLYTVVVRGANNTTGIALVETYELP
jgi:unsaturated rhamnogalacturonyl hydrolase